MIDLLFSSLERAAGLFLILGNVAVFPGLIMFWIRGGHRGGKPSTSAYFVWERSKEHNLYPLVVVHVALAFLAQVAIGGALLQAGLLAAWIGWVTIVWNLAWFVVVVRFSPRDIYFPALHHAMPLLTGIGLLLWQVA